MFAEQAILKQIFTLATTAVPQLGLYLNGTDPLTNLAAAEISNSRVNLTTSNLSWDTDHLKNSVAISCGPLPSCSVGGWFISYTGSTTDTILTAPFSGPITVSTDDYLVFALNTISINIV